MEMSCVWFLQAKYFVVAMYDPDKQPGSAS